MLVIRGFAFLALSGAAIASPTRLAAQQNSVQLSFDATIGRSFGRGGGERANRDGPALDALLAWRARGRGLHGVFGFGTGVQGRRDSENCLALPGTNCVPDYPRVFTLALLVGLEQRGRIGAARMLVGPTHYRIDGGGSALGGQARLELVSPSVHRIAVVASARGGMVWHLDRQDFRMGAVGIGLGIY